MGTRDPGQASHPAVRASGAHVTGHGLFADVRGPGDGPALLYLHGGPGQGSWEFMAVQGDRLAREVRVVGLDQRGVGRSVPLPEGTSLTIQDLVEDCERLRVALGIERWALLGHSWGGALALRYAVASPAAVTAVVFENPAWDVALSSRAALPHIATMLARRGRVAEAETARAAAGRAAAGREATAKALRAAYLDALDALGEDRDRFFVPDRSTRRRLEQLRHEHSAEEGKGDRGSRHHEAILRDKAYYESVLPLLAQLSAPALLIRGGQDPITSTEQEEAFRRASPRNQVLVFQRAGHFVHADDPGPYAQAVSAFVRSRARAAGPGPAGPTGLGPAGPGPAGQARGPGGHPEAPASGRLGGRADAEPAAGGQEQPMAAGQRAAREAREPGQPGTGETHPGEGPSPGGELPRESTATLLAQGSADWGETLRAEAAGYARVALANIRREFPSGVHHMMSGPGDFPHRPRARTPVFYGSYDWHSCVEMHWLLVRLLRVAADAVPAGEIRAVLRSQFDPVGLSAEAEFIAGPSGRSERPYGWGWALALVYEASALDDPDAARWAEAMAPLADTVTSNFLRWLPKAAYPVRCGTHPNSAFGLSLALGYARLRAQSGDRRLLEAITSKAMAWYGADTIYPAAWEPSGQDFLSPALTEAELMARILPEQEFSDWLGFFLPGIASGEPAALFTPVTVSDPSDGQIAHLHGLNASRAWCWRRIAETLPEGDARIGPATQAARNHAAAALPHVIGDDYMVEHWLACYAVLLLS